METLSQFKKRLHSILDAIGPEILKHNEDEFWMIRSPYEYAEYYAAEKRLINTSVALPLARGLHNGVYRKSTLILNGKTYRVPYLIHPLMVARMLIDIQVPLSPEDEDILLAAALLHDVIEDIPFPNHGLELIEQYHLDPRVYETVKKVSKRKDFTEEEEIDFFDNIARDKIAALVKLSDRGHNVEDMYNMSAWKIHEYVGETRKFFLPMCFYARRNYPDIEPMVEILQDKIISLTQMAEALVDRYAAQEQALHRELQELVEENRLLRETWKRLWQEEGDSDD